MQTENFIIVVGQPSTDFYDYSISDIADKVIMIDLTGYDPECKYVTAVDYHADLYVDSDEDTITYFIENGIAAIKL